MFQPPSGLCLVETQLFGGGDGAILIIGEPFSYFGPCVIFAVLCVGVWNRKCDLGNIQPRKKTSLTRNRRRCLQATSVCVSVRKMNCPSVMPCIRFSCLTGCFVTRENDNVNHSYSHRAISPQQFEWASADENLRVFLQISRKSWRIPLSVLPFHPGQAWFQGQAQLDKHLSVA